ncbi:MAG: TIR domain-containing protein [Candidatus Aminicenantes bacterium]|nr:TIR domain-containing protein [Candidatus Aminicenantes bacterium]
MLVLISWAGSRSKHVAESFKNWLGLVIQNVEPWISLDIDKGSRWEGELAERLERSKIGIFCLTKDNLEAPWLLFEAGAVSKISGAQVCTFLYDVDYADIKQPLAQFQHTKNEKDEIFKLMKTINQAVLDAGEKALAESQLEDAFNTYWGRLEATLKTTPAPESHKPTPSRSQLELIQEVLGTVRNMQTVLQDVQSRVYKTVAPHSRSPFLSSRDMKFDSIMAVLEEFMDKYNLRGESGQTGQSGSEYDIIPQEECHATGPTGPDVISQKPSIIK